MLVRHIRSQQGRLTVNLFDTAQAIGEYLAQKILAEIAETVNPHYLLGLPTGATPMPLFENLIKQAENLDDSNKKQIAEKLCIVVMDDFILMESNENIPNDQEWSAPGFISRKLIAPLNDALGPYKIEMNRILYPQPNRINQLRDNIIKMGGLDLQVLATDPYEGYVAQNFQDGPFVKSEQQKIGQLNASFLKHHSWAKIYRGITFDLNDFTEMIKANECGRFALIVTGEPKEEVLVKTLGLREFTPAVPLSFIWNVPELTTVYSDRKQALISVD
jgi:6-phosphogluconolactonase/glucosamine-6-phosphate isomerase/deaminase